MDGSNLPLHVVERAERRWAAMLSRQAAKLPFTMPAGTPQSSPDHARKPAGSKPGQPILGRPEWNRTP